MLNEALLIKKLQAKDDKALQELISEFEPRLSRAAKLLIANEQEAEELVYDTFTHAFFGIKKFRQESNLFSWLYRILLNKFYDHLRQQKREVILKSSFQHVTKTTDYPKGEIHFLFQQNLPDLLSGLSADHREVVFLKYLEEMTVKEIAKTLKIPENTVKTRLYRAISNLRKFLKRRNFLPK